MNRQMRLYLLGGILTFLFIVFSFFVRAQVFAGFDVWATNSLQSHIGTAWDTFFSIFSVLGTIDVTSIILVVILLLYRNRNSLYILLSFGIILTFELFDKYFIFHPGPPVKFARYKEFFTYPSDYLPQPPSAFPSGHAGRTIFLSGMLLFLLWRTKRFSPLIKWACTILIFIYDCILLISRVDLGEHWASDVIGGTILGLALVSINGGLIIRKMKNR